MWTTCRATQPTCARTAYAPLTRPAHGLRTPAYAQDVDDLKSIDALEEYVSFSAVVLVMLGSHRYFSSANCRREVEAARLGNKPLVLVHESDPDKNGSPLHELKAICPADIRSYLFDGRDVLPWHRVYAFQRVTMIGIAEAALVKLPAYTGYVRLSLKLPGDVRDQALEFRQRVVLYTSLANPGAGRVALELSGSKARIHNSSCLSRLKEASEQERRSRGSSTEQLNVAITCTDVEPERFDDIVFLLYLNEHSFSVGDTLRTEVRRALASGAFFCLIHENDPAAGGVSFGTIISSAGADLVAAGLFAPLATPWHAGNYRAVSIKLALMSLGARVARPQMTHWLQLRQRTQPTADHGDQLLLTHFTSAHGQDALGGGGPGGAAVELTAPSPGTVRFHLDRKKEEIV